MTAKKAYVHAFVPYKRRKLCLGGRSVTPGWSNALPMDDLAAVIKKFREHELSVRRLYKSDDEFRALCEDYALATSAISRWKGDRNRSTHYRLLVDELESEVLEFIEGRHPHQVLKGTGNGATNFDCKPGRRT